MKFEERANRAAGISRIWLVALVLGTLFTTGCDLEENVVPSRLEKLSGDGQCGLPGELLPEPIVVRVLGGRSSDLLGRTGSRAPAANVPIRFRVERLSEFKAEPSDSPPEAQEPGALLPYPTLLASPEGVTPEGPLRNVTIESDRSGIVKVWVKLGTATDDFRIEAILDIEGKKPIKEHIRIVSGVKKIATAQEGTVGSSIDLGVQLAEWNDGKHLPLQDRVVFFRLVGQPHGTRESADIRNRRDVTDEDGIRGGTQLTLGDRPGVYQVLAEVEPQPPETGSDEPERQIRGILFRIVAIDWWLVLARFAIGSLLFLLGVRFLAGGFLLILSPYLHFESGPWTENRFVGYLGGGVIGLTFQSWSTVSAHLVSFANSGLLNAHGGKMLLVGASLGATALPQILSFELSFLATPLLALGLVCRLVPRRHGFEPWGWVLLGAGLVFTSWSQLNEGADYLALSETFKASMHSLDVDYSQSFVSYGGALVWLLFVGFCLGFVLRTSNLLVVFGILLASHGVISSETTVPLIVGGNLGAAVLLFSRSFMKRHEAFRLAGAALIFQIVTAVVVVVLCLIPVGDSSAFLWIVDYATPGQLFLPTAEGIGHHVATAHTLYNLGGGLAVLLAPTLFSRLLDKFVPVRAPREEAKPHRLDPDLLPVPSLALRQVRREVVYLTELGQKTVAEGFDAFRYADAKLADQVVRRVETVVGMQRDIARFLVLVSENQLARTDAIELKTLGTCSVAIVRIAACAERLHDLAVRRAEEGVGSTDEMDKELSDIYDLVLGQFDNIVALLHQRDPRIEENVARLVERLAKVRTRMETQWRQRIEQSSESQDAVSTHLQLSLFQESFDLLFRVAGHLASVSREMRLLSTENF